MFAAHGHALYSADRGVMQAIRAGARRHGRGTAANSTSYDWQRLARERSTARFGATERQQADWEEFAGGARVEIAILMEPSPREPVPLLPHGVDGIRALAAAVPPGGRSRCSSRARPRPVDAGAGRSAPDVPLQV